MKRIILMLATSLFSYKNSHSQWFSETALEDSLIFGNLVWGDYDLDGDQDLLTMGVDPSNEQQTVLYRNVNSTLNKVQTPFIGVQNGTCNFFDFDNDNDLDVFISGFKSGEQTGIVKTYRNENGEFEEVDLGIDSSIFTSVAFFDLENDGDEDLLITGWIDGAAPGKVQLYRNENEMYVIDSNIVFPDVNFGVLDVTDLDHDGNIDIVIAGQNENWGNYTEIFEFDHQINSFVSQDYNIQEVSNAWVKFFDYNDDGHDDLLLYGQDTSYNNRIFIYENDGVSLTLHQSLDSLSSSTSKNPIVTGDIDNDGDNDIIVGGSNDDYTYTMLAYLNEENSFEFAPQVQLPEWGSNTSLAFSDVDQDLDLDFSFAGRDNQTVEAVPIHIFLNDSAAINTPPLAPSITDHIIEDSSVTLTWGRGSDNQSNQMGLTYNIGLYFTTGSKWIIAPKSLDNGKRLVSERGNMLHDTTITFNDLDLGMYEWRVQTIDNSYVPSGFTVNTFEISDGSSVNVKEEVINPLRCQPVPFSDYFTLKNTAGKPIENITIQKISGELIFQLETINQNNNKVIKTDTWENGVYFISYLYKGVVFTQKVIKI